jgi:hypothetical protein
MTVRNGVVSLVALVSAVMGLRVLADGAPPDVKDIQLIAGKLSWAAKITSYQYTVKAIYSNSFPDDQWVVTYREKAGAYFYDTSYLTKDPAHGQLYAGDSESWDGTVGMCLDKSTGALDINKLPYPFKLEWVQLPGLFFPFRFVDFRHYRDLVETPQLKDVVDKLADATSALKGKLTHEVKNSSSYICLTNDGGYDNTVYQNLTIKTYFSASNDYYPTIVETYDSNGKLVGRYTIKNLALYRVNSDLSIPYPSEIATEYYNTSTGKLVNAGTIQFSNVVFNSDQINDFQIDPSKARVVYDSRVKKVIPIPQ